MSRPWMRTSMSTGLQTAFSVSGYTRPGGRPLWNDDFGTMFPFKDGSVTALSAAVHVLTHSVNGTITLQARVLGDVTPDVIASTTSPTITGTGVIEFSELWDPGTNPFELFTTLGIGLYLLIDSGTFTFKPIATVELDFDAP